MANNNCNPTCPTGVNKYTGLRYVPKFMGQWDNTQAYEPLMIVQYQGNSYTSKTYVPIGVLITNETYWAITGNYNAQVEQYRQEVVALANNVAKNENDITDIFTELDIINADVDKLNKFFLQKPVNIVNAGADPTGIEDASPIINNLLQTSDVYIPEGQFKLNSSIITNGHSIIGSGPDSVLNFGNVVVGIFSNASISETHVYIGDFKINAINITQATMQIIHSAFYHLENIVITDVNNCYGIISEPSYATSRALTVNNVKILGYGSNSTGFMFNNKSHDSRLTNVEIMGFHTGIYTNSYLILLNVHIWYGPYGSRTITLADFNTSIGISAFYHLTATNLYIDSFSKYIKLRNTGLWMSINNLVILDDEAFTHPEAYSYVFDTSEVDDRTIKLRITGGMIRIQDKMRRIVTNDYILNNRDTIQMVNVIFNTEFRTTELPYDPAITTATTGRQTISSFSSSVEAVTTNAYRLFTVVGTGGYIECHGYIVGSGMYQLKAYILGGSGDVDVHFLDVPPRFKLAYDKITLDGARGLYALTFYVVPLVNATYWSSGLDIFTLMGCGAYILKQNEISFKSASSVTVLTAP